LEKVITQKPIEGFAKQIFLLTDGGVSNTHGVIRMIEANNKYSRVHTIGIGSACSKDLIIECANKGKGRYVFIEDYDNPA
jgi:Ca-activated chloride channel homolog